MASRQRQRHKLELIGATGHRGSATWTQCGPPKKKPATRGPQPCRAWRSARRHSPAVGPDTVGCCLRRGGSGLACHETVKAAIPGSRCEAVSAGERRPKRSGGRNAPIGPGTLPCHLGHVDLAGLAGRERCNTTAMANRLQPAPQPRIASVYLRMRGWLHDGSAKSSRRR
jgi:hypothetical protein